MLALALHLAALPLVQGHATALDAFGQPICSEHQDGAAQPSDPAKHDSACCDFCCTVPLAAPGAVYAPDAPVKFTWTRLEPIALELPLPAPSRHRLAPPRGPPLA